MNISWLKSELKVLAGALLTIMLIGLITGLWGWVSILVLLPVMVWWLSQILQLYQWLISGASTRHPPDLFGLCQNIVEQICAIKKDNFTQQKQAEELINRFEAATAAMPDAMLIVDDEYNLEWANDVSMHVLGINVERDKGHKVSNIVRDPKIIRYLNHGDFTRPLEFQSSRSEQNDLVLRVIPYGKGHNLFYVQDHLEVLRLQQVREDFIANASHELRTPLTAVVGYLEALSIRDTASSTTNTGINAALQQALRMKRLVEDLLSLSRLESLPLNQSKEETIDLAELVDECVQIVAGSQMFHQQQFKNNLPRPCLYVGDSSELRSAIQNTIENAIKYSSSDASVIFDWQIHNNKGASLYVRDQGEGIDEQHLMRLTERFYRVDAGRSRDLGGTGLGLSIVKHVMERHGGQVYIQSEVGVGTTVELSFPASMRIDPDEPERG